MYVTEFKET